MLRLDELLDEVKLTDEDEADAAKAGYWPKEELSVINGVLDPLDDDDDDEDDEDEEGTNESPFRPFSVLLIESRSLEMGSVDPGWWPGPCKLVKPACASIAWKDMNIFFIENFS